MNQHIDTDEIIFTTLFIQAKENAIIILDEKGIIQDVNPAFTACFGYRPSQIIGKYFSILFTPEDLNKQKPERELKNVLEKGQASDNNYMVKVDGTVTWVSGESLLSKKEDGSVQVIKVIQNIDVQKTAEHALSTLHDLNEQILSSITDAVLVIDQSLQIKKYNNAFLSVFNGPIVDRPNNFLLFLKEHDSNDSFLAAINQAFATGIGFNHHRIELKRPAKEPLLYEVNSSLFGSASGDNNQLLIFHDITLSNQLERNREDIIGFVAHELRNPLANLGLCNELLQIAQSNENYADIPMLLQRSKNNLVRLNKMIAELYGAARISSGNIFLEMASYNFGDMISEAVDTIQLLQPDYTIRVEGDADFIVYGDRYRMIEVVTNYVSNGIKYSNGSTEVELQISASKEMVTVSVKDRGLGIPVAQLPFIFDRFFRAEKTKQLEGLGFGLYFCQGIINAHRGKVWAESEEGKGSVFYFSVPREP